MRHFLVKFLFLAIILLGLPLFGVILAGLPLRQYLEFPPETRYVIHAPFSWTAFAVYGLFILAVVIPVLIKALKGLKTYGTNRFHACSFPWWGWVGVAIGLIAWTLAWTRFSWFTGFQRYTFTPLWLSFILAINALTYRRKGHCMMLDRPGIFLLLFPTSAVFWWFFEYLNRFVQNWHYVGVHFSPWAYVLHATLSFSTVLPAVLGSQEWILGSPWIEKGFNGVLPLAFARSKFLSWGLLILSIAGLAVIGIWPNFLFPLLWVSPLLTIASLQILTGKGHILVDIAHGDWRLVISSALAALFCGWFWEMWNYFSLAKWEYIVPYVHRYQIFEMPILGYAGYLPFGLECAVIGEILERKWYSLKPHLITVK